MHYMKHHAEELECIQVKWKKGYYAVEDGHIVPGAPFYPSEHPFSAVDDPDFPARRLEIDEERYQQTERGETPFDPMVRLLRRVRCIAWRREDGKARLHHQGSERGHLHHLAPAETPEKKAGEIPTGAAMGEAITGTKVASPEQRGGYPRDDHPRGVQPAHVRYEANTEQGEEGRGRAGRAGTSWPSESRASKQNFYSPCKMWRTSGGKNTVPSKKCHKVSLKTKAEMEQKIDLMTLTRDRVRAAVQRAERQVSSPERLAPASPPVRAEGRGGSTRRWANHPAATPESDQHPTGNGRVGWRRDSEGNRELQEKEEITEKMLAETLLSMEEAEEVKRQLDVRLKAAEQDAENYRECCETALEDLRLEKHTNKVAMKVAMQAAHCQDQERLTLQKAGDGDPTRGQRRARTGAELPIRDRPYAAPDRTSRSAADGRRRMKSDLSGAVSRKAGRNRRPDDKPGRPKTTVGRTERRPNFETANDGGE